MAYRDIATWEGMSKEELYQELVRIYGDDIPSIDKIVYIYVDNCYELSAQICEGYPDCFVILWPEYKVNWQGFANQEPVRARPYQVTIGPSFDYLRPKPRWLIEDEC